MTKENRIATQVLIDHKEHQSIEQFATMLETIAQKLRTEGKFVFMQGEKQIEIAPSSQVKVEYEYEVKGDKHSFEIEFDWYTGDSERKSMTIK